MAQKPATFLARAHAFVGELRSDRYPNAFTLADLCECSRNTSQRTIYRLRDEYLVPLDYDSTRKGYFLKNKNYELPQLLPAGKDELTALLLARDLVGVIDAKDLKDSLDRLWRQMASNSQAVTVELEPLSRVFSSNLTAIGKLVDDGLLQYVLAAARGDNVQFRYSSPWKGTEGKIYWGRVLHVHFSDGSLYLKFWDATGREIILNTSFIDQFQVLDAEIKFESQPTAGVDSAEGWLEGFGVWSGAEPEIIEIRIAPPGSKYYARQTWHEDQEDEWVAGDILVRRMPAIVSPELVRRVLSLGRFVVGVKPEGLGERVREEVARMGRMFGDWN